MTYEIPIPSIRVWQDESRAKRWCWAAPNGASGTHEPSFEAAARVAIGEMRLAQSAFDLSAPGQARFEVRPTTQP